jgi:hypothetical protein
VLLESVDTGDQPNAYFLTSPAPGMASATRDESPEEGVEFIREGDGRITARDLETGVASFGETKAEALRMLAEALELHEGGGEPVTDEDLEEWGLDGIEPGDKELPEFMR